MLKIVPILGDNKQNVLRSEGARKKWRFSRLQFIGKLVCRIFMVVKFRVLNSDINSEILSRGISDFLLTSDLTIVELNK